MNSFKTFFYGYSAVSPKGAARCPAGCQLADEGGQLAAPRTVFLVLDGLGGLLSWGGGEMRTGRDIETGRDFLLVLLLSEHYCLDPREAQGVRV